MNWCDNTLIVRGDTAELEVFFEQNRDNKNYLSFSKSVPLSHHVPSRIMNIYEEIDINELDREAIEKWGCGWDCVCFEIDRASDRYIYDFDTPLTAPLVWIERISFKYPNLEFELESEEIFQDYCITMKIKNGNRLFFEQSSLKDKIHDLSGCIGLVSNLFETVKSTNKLMESLRYSSEYLTTESLRYSSEYLTTESLLMGKDQTTLGEQISSLNESLQNMEIDISEDVTEDSEENVDLRHLLDYLQKHLNQ